MEQRSRGHGKLHYVQPQLRYFFFRGFPLLDSISLLFSLHGEWPARFFHKPDHLLTHTASRAFAL